MTDAAPKIVHVPWRGLRCRELSCQAEIVMVATTRGKTMPLDREVVPAGDWHTDARGLFLVLELDGEPVAHGLTAAEKVGAEIPELVYAGHWGTCKAPSRFRR